MNAPPFGEARIFSTLYAFNGCRNINPFEQDRHKTSFICHSGTFQYVHMPFWLTNAPTTFQRALDLILTRFKWKTCLVYIDEIIMFSKDIEEQIHQADQILTILGEAGVSLYVKRYHLFSDSVAYVVHIIRPRRLEIDQTHTECLKDAKPPTNRSSLQSFLGLCNVYRRFIQYFPI